MQQQKSVQGPVTAQKREAVFSFGCKRVEEASWIPFMVKSGSIGMWPQGRWKNGGGHCRPSRTIYWKTKGQWNHMASFRVCRKLKMGGLEMCWDHVINWEPKFCGRISGGLTWWVLCLKKFTWEKKEKVRLVVSLPVQRVWGKSASFCLLRPGKILLKLQAYPKLTESLEIWKDAINKPEMMRKFWNIWEYK